MKISKNLLCMLIVVVMLSSLFTGCGKKEETVDNQNNQEQSDEIDTSKEVKLKMYLVGDGAPDVPKIYAKVNEILKEKVNATLDVQFMSWAEVGQKYPLTVASGENFDLIFSANWQKFTNFARNGAYYEITDDMLKKYAPQTWEKDQKVIEGCRLQENGELYMLGMNSKEYQTHCYVVRGDLMDKYGIKDIKNYDDFTKYLDAVKAETDIIPFDGAGEFNKIFTYAAGNEDETAMGVPGVAKNSGVTYKYGTTKILTSDEYNTIKKPWFEKMYDAAQKGYWTSDAPIAKYTEKDQFKSGRSASCIENLSNIPTIYNSVMLDHPDWDVRAYPILPDGKTSRVNPSTQNGISIGAFSKNPERALMVLDLLRHDKELNMLTTYGIQGEYWEEDGDYIKLIGDKKLQEGYPADQACPWGWRNDEFYKPLSGSLPNMAELKKHFEDNYKEDPLRDFVFNPEPVQALHDQLETYKNDQKTLFEYGLKPKEEIDTMLADEVEKKKQLGLEEYEKEVQKQIDEYLKTKE